MNKKTKFPNAISTIFLIVTLTHVARAQYGGYMSQGSGYDGGYHGSGYNGEYGGGGGEDRPKVHLGLRVKIPAMKFELPRMSLPKITISAKIRQPDKPRVIQLPEINLDTSSNVDKGRDYGGQQNYGQQQQQQEYGHKTTSGGHSARNYGNGGYESASTSYASPQNYGNSYKEQTFSFSTHEEPARGYGNNNNNNNNMKYGIGQNHMNYRQQQQQQQFKQSYSSSNVHPSYMTTSNYENKMPAKDPDLGFEINEATKRRKRHNQYPLTSVEMLRQILRS